MSALGFAFLGFLTGLIVGGACSWWLWRRERAMAARLGDDADAVVEQVRTTFAALSREALSVNTHDFLQLAKSKLEAQSVQSDRTLEEKKKLIDASLTEMNAKFAALHGLIQTTEKQRAEAHGVLTTQITRNTEATARLQTTTAHLREALANPQRRGQWGERMAEDVLRLVGFIDGVNYHKQQTCSNGARPDYTFCLPGNQCVHMDVKFPLENYLKVLDARDEAARQICTTQFLRDVRSRIKEVGSRGYIDVAAGTVDYMLVFIPNEQVYGFIHEHDAQLLDDALREKVVLCSPLTLYAILSVIRQAVENFRFEQNSRRILDLLAAFRGEWQKCSEVMDKVGKRLDDATAAFRELSGVRSRKLEVQLDKVADMQIEGISPSRDDEGKAIVRGELRLMAGGQ